MDPRDAVRVAGPDDGELVRALRNEGRGFFHDTREIGSTEQAAWWKDRMRASAHDFCCLLVGEPPVGYGMLTRREGRLWVTLVVTERARGLGVGTFIYRRLALERSNEDIFAAIRADNVSSLRAAKKAGFVRTDTVSAPDGADATWIVLRSRE